MKIAILSAVCAGAGALLLPTGVHGGARSVLSPSSPRAAVVASVSPGRAAGHAAAAVAASLAVLLSTEARADVGLELLSPITQFKLADGTNVGDKAEALKGLLKVPERDPEADAAAQKKREEAAKVRFPGTQRPPRVRGATDHAHGFQPRKMLRADMPWCGRRVSSLSPKQRCASPRPKRKRRRRRHAWRSSGQRRRRRARQMRRRGRRGRRSGRRRRRHVRRSLSSKRRRSRRVSRCGDERKCHTLDNPASARDAASVG